MTNFSIIIPLYNKEKTIRSTLESVLQQDYSHYEVIVVDDGSTDGSAAVVAGFTDGRIHLFRKENGGPSSARNYGIQNARFDWAILLDADDLILPGALAHFAKTIKNYRKIDMVVGNFELEEAGTIRRYHRDFATRRIKNAFKSWFLKELMPCAGTYCCKKSLLVQHPYQEQLMRSEDTDVLFRLFRETRIIQTNYATMRYRRDYSVESLKRTSIVKDFQGHLDFSGSKSLWEKICLYELYIEAKNNYPDEVETTYPDIDKQLLLKFAYHCAFWYRFFFRMRQQRIRH